MKREIKFRLFRVHDGDMLCPVNPVWFEENNWRYDDFAKCAEEENCVLMQFTGLLDKNGKEIYEGDIIQTETDKLMVVTWSKKFASFCLKREDWFFLHWFGESCDPEKTLIRGNIYENPRLLKRDEKCEGV